MYSVPTYFLTDYVLPETPPVAGPLPDLGRTNRIYLLLMLLVLGISLLGAVLPREVRWVVLLAGDPFLLLVVLWLARRERRPLRPALRLAWPGLPAMGLGLLMGVGAYTIGAVIQLVVYLIFRQTQGADMGRYLSDPFLLAIFLISAVILAPLTEELIFRGYFLGIYEHYLGPAGGIVLVSLLFAALHMQLLGVFSLLPVSFMLTYMALRSGSLLPGMAAHFSFNLTSSLLGVAGLNLPTLVVGLMACCLLITGPIFGGLSLVHFHRSRPQPGAHALRTISGSWLSHNWPLLLAGAIYLTFVIVDLMFGRKAG